MSNPSLPHGVPLYRGAHEPNPPHPDQRGSDDCPPYGRRDTDRPIHQLAVQMAELHAKLDEHGRQPAAGRKPWSYARLVAVVSGAVVLGGALTSFLAWLGAPLGSPGSEMRNIRAEIQQNARDARNWREADARWKMKWGAAILLNRLDICRDRQPAAQDQCYLAYQTELDRRGEYVNDTAPPSHHER